MENKKENLSKVEAWLAQFKDLKLETSVLAWNEGAMLKYTWLLSIGDWSGDGHKECENFMIHSNYTNKEARKSYFEAKKLYPKICPEEVANRYQQPPTKKQLQAWIDAGVLSDEFSAAEYENNFGAYDMANVVLNYIKLASSDFDYSISEEGEDTFHFWGEIDNEEDYPPSFGYGLFD
jgi:hypothetical protein